MAAISESGGASIPHLELPEPSLVRKHNEASLVKKISDVSYSELDNDGCKRMNMSSNLDHSQTNEHSDPVVDIVINNVVCSFNLRCHLNLKQIALNGCNVEYRRENGMVTMKIRNPLTTASIWSSGKITCTGATSDADAKKASRRFARVIQQLGFKVKFTNFRIVNVLGTCAMPFAIKISQFSAVNRQHASYEPELHPGVTYKIKELKATLKIFSTGNITITAPNIENVQRAVENIFPLVHEHRKERIPQGIPLNKKKLLCHGRMEARQKDEKMEELFDSPTESDDCDIVWD